MSHSILPPSSAGIWGKPGGCTGWVSMAYKYPKTRETPESKEGTASHEIAERMNRANARARIGYPSKEELVGSLASNNVIFTEEMYDAAEMFANDVGMIIRQTSVFGGPHLGIEHRVEAKRIHELSYGTIDAFIYNQNRDRLYIWDYKFGFTAVEVYENWQLINYLAGLIEELGVDGHMDQHTTVHVRIVQPRAFHRDGPIREWVVKASDLRPYFNILEDNAHKALGPNAEYETGSHCKYCLGRHACPAALKAGIGLYEVAAQPIPLELNAEALSVQYAIVQRARKQLEYLESGFEEQIKALIRGGENVQGYRVEEGVGRECWAKPVEEVIALGDMLGHDLRKGGVITPNQARKLGIDADVIMAYSKKPKTGFKVVPDNGNKAKQIFSK